MQSGLDQIDSRLLATTIGFDVIAQTLVLVQSGETRILNDADVDEAVIAAVDRRDEAIALVGIEEFNDTNRHETFPYHENKKPTRNSADGAG